MKWSKKGHEFDQTWEAIRAGKRLYLFGAGESGVRSKGSVWRSRGFWITTVKSRAAVTAG